jgi:glycosyltransferase involved in cell wall biosynthesis
VTEEPFVSIVINNFNYGRYVAAAIESALAQTHPRTETIVVDDGSTDDSRSVVARYADRTRLLMKANGGQASAVNAGFALARGDVVIFLDSDDMLLPGTAAAIADAFRAAPGTVRVQYRVEVVDRDGRPTGELIPAAYVTMPSGELGPGIARFNNVTWWPPTSGHAFSARTLEDILPMPEEPFQVAVDYYLVRASTLCGPIVSLDRVGAYYRRHGDNEDSRDRLDLEQVRVQIELTRSAHGWLKEFAKARRLGPLAADADDVADLRYFAMRMMSRKLDPSRHPVAGDTLARLALRGVRVAVEQTHLPWRVRALAALWFLAVLSAPRGPARSLAEKYSYPETRPRLGRILRRS